MKKFRQKELAPSKLAVEGRRGAKGAGAQGTQGAGGREERGERGANARLRFKMAGRKFKLPCEKQGMHVSAEKGPQLKQVYT